MNALVDLKKLFEKNDIEVTYFDGYQLLTKNFGKWGMAFGEYRRDGEVVSRKEIEELIKK